MDRRSSKNKFTEFVERFDEAVIQGIMVCEDTVLVKQRADTSGDLWEYRKNCTNLNKSKE